MSDIKNYVLVGKDNIEGGVYSGRQPRQAALKVANAGAGTKATPVTFKIRERGTKKLHVFKGWKEVVDAPAKRPAWMPERINKPFVEKIGIENPKK